MKYLKTVFLLFLCINSVKVSAQKADESYKAFFEVGKQCPDYIFNDVANFSKKEASIQDFKGKWLILDFWHKHCSSCIKSFPIHNREQIEYKNNVQFLLIGMPLEKAEYDKTNEKYRETQKLFARLQKKINLQIPCVFDTVYANRITEPISGFPFLVIVDPDGIVRGSTWTLDGIDLAGLTKNSRPILPDFYRERSERYKYDRDKPYLVNSNGGPDSNFIFRSMLSKWMPNKDPFHSPSSILDYEAKHGRLDVLGPQNLQTLYLFAFLGSNYTFVEDPKYGKYWPKAVLELQDSSIFTGDKKTGKNIYSYSLTVPSSKATAEFMMQIMRQDLQNYFGFKAQFEIRKMPCWKLVAMQKARKSLLEQHRIITQSTKASQVASGFQIIDIKDKSMSYVISALAICTGMQGENPPIIDETGIDGNFNLYMEFIPGDFDSIVKSLRNCGLDLIKGEKEMKVLVIRDSTQQPN